MLRFKNRKYEMSYAGNPSNSVTIEHFAGWKSSQSFVYTVNNVLKIL